MTFVVSYLGVKLDADGSGLHGKGSLPEVERLGRWRPNVAVAHLLQPKVQYLLHDGANPEHEKLAKLIARDIEVVSPSTSVRLEPVAIDDAWDMEAMCRTLDDAMHAIRKEIPSGEDIRVHLTTGNNRVQACLFWIVARGRFKARFVHTIAPNDPTLPPAKQREVSHPWGGFREDAKPPTEFDFVEEWSRLSPKAAARRGTELDESCLSPLYRAAVERALRVAKSTQEPILLSGPTGSGKTFLAKRIHEASGCQGEMVAVNCATFVGEMAGTALFGSREGAFTGARQRDGFLRQANEGVLFLDEIGELPLDAQAQLLKAIEEKCYHPVGSDKTVKSDFRLVAATNRDLYDAALKGRFRSDLLARIDTFVVRLPALAERREDIETLCNHELSLRAPVRRFDEPARRLYISFACSNEAPWTGNLRDLRSSIVRLHALSRGDFITVHEVERERDELKRRWSGGERPAQHQTDRVAELLGDGADRLCRLDRLELSTVLETLSTCGSLAEAGQLLFGADSAKNPTDRIRRLLLRHGLFWREKRVVRRPAPNSSPQGDEHEN